MNRRSFLPSIGAALATITAAKAATPDLTIERTGTTTTEKAELMHIAYNIAASKHQSTIIYLSVGNLPKMKAEQHLKEVMTKCGEWGKGKIWLPVRGDTSKTEVVFLPGKPSQEEVLAVYRELCKA